MGMPAESMAASWREKGGRSWLMIFLLPGILLFLLDPDALLRAFEGWAD